MNSLAVQIDLWLRAEARWFTAAEICARFEVTPRALRSHDGKPGLMAEFAVSSDEGYMHVRHLSDEEFALHCNRLRNHALAELTTLKAWRQSRHNQLTGARADLREVHGGQGVIIP